MEIKEAFIEDIDAICELHHKLALYHEEQMVGVFKPYSFNDHKEFLKEIFKDEKVHFYLASIENEYAGYMMMEIRNRPPFMNETKMGYINNIFVDDKYRGKGICSALIEHATNIFKKDNIHEIHLNVYDFNKEANDRYEHLGFNSYCHLMSKKI